MASVMQSREQARWLIAQYVERLHTRVNYDAKLSLTHDQARGGQFVPRKTWINVPMHEQSGFESVIRDVAPVRAFMEVVGQLIHTPNFQWLDYYDAFWKHALIAPINARSSVSRGYEATEFDCFKQLVKTKGPKFMLDFSHAPLMGKELEMLRELFFMDTEKALGEHHDTALSALTAPAHVSSSSTRNSPSDRVEIGIYLPSMNIPASSLKKLRAVLKDVADRDEHGGSGIRFEVTTIWMPTCPMSDPVQVEALSDLLVSKKLAIRHLWIRADLKSVAPLACRHAFQSLLYRTLSVKSLNDAPPSLASLALERAPRTPYHVISICSALRYSNHLKELRIHWEPRVPEPGEKLSMLVVWAWIAYGIFHPDSEARLDRLGVTRLPIAEDDLAVFESIISSPHPGKQLWVVEHGELPTAKGFEEVGLPANMRLFVRVHVKTKIRVHPKIRSPVLVPVTLDTDEFEVSILLAKWACVVVPGYGSGWILCDSIVSQRKEPSRCVPCNVRPSDEVPPLQCSLSGSKVKAFDRTKNNSDSDDRDGVKLLLRMVGSGLEGLSLPFHGMNNEDLREVLSCCPNLTHLDVAGNAITDISVLVDRYRASQCRISSMRLRSLCENTAIVSQLADLLAEPYSKPLRYVDVGSAAERTVSLEKLAQALSTNQSLRSLSLATWQFDDQSIPRRLESAFSGISEIKSIPSTKVAFLSVILHDRNKSSSSRKLLDSSIASQVFAFAGIPNYSVLRTHTALHTSILKTSDVDQAPQANVTPSSQRNSLATANTTKNTPRTPKATTMKYPTTLAFAAVLAINGALAADPAATVHMPPTATTAPIIIISPKQAFEAVKDLAMPAGVTLTGSVDPINEPPTTKKNEAAAANAAADDDDDNDHKEWFGGYGGLGGWGRWGGWGGLGPYRFGFSCGGLGGWAYPLGYWNTFGAGLYGGGCGLGIPFGGLFYC